ncbi:MAG: elongation factor P hydroxylase [Ketobacteraceae bacterium]|nr:elongation factor P hydroxylase [Ketobacteraceae bacterium]
MVDELISLFNQLFLESENTVLIKGDDEPVYLPADGFHGQHRIVFAHGFFNSALHEIAHWCVAGPERRLLEDFGYWYEPDGRSLAQQKAFEAVEVKPQALEWIFAVSCGRRFRVSADNLALIDSGVEHDDRGFRQNIHREVQHRLDQGLPPRAKRFSEALIEHFQPGLVLNKTLFPLSDIL